MTALLFVLSLGYMESEILPDLPNELAHDWYGVYTWLIIAVAAIVIVGIWAWWDRKRTRDEVAEARKNIGDLEKRLSALEEDLDAERSGRERAQRMLVASLRHHAEYSVWCQSGHRGQPPDIPTELLREEL